MKTLFAALLISLIPTLAQATTTWSNVGPAVSLGSPAVKAVCSTGTEAAPSGATAGLPLAGINGFAVHVESAAGNFTAGKLLAYVYNPVSGAWNRNPDLDLNVSGGITGQSFLGFNVNASLGRIAYVPSGLAVAVNVFLLGANKGK